MLDGECCNCGKYGYIEWHHIILRSQATYMKNIKINLIELCQDCHRNAPHAVHRNRQMDLKLKQQLQAKLQTMFTNEFYSKEKIQEKLECTEKETDAICKKLSLFKEGYSKEKLVSRLMGGRLYG